MSPTAHDLWRRSRGPLAALLVLLLGGLVYAVARSGEHHGRLDPRSPDPLGSRATAQLLSQHGVTLDVVVTATAAAARTGPDTTLLITAPDQLSGRQLTLLHRATERGGGRTVLLAPSRVSLSTLVPQTQAVSAANVSRRSPGCHFAPAQRAGDVDLGGILYRTTAPGAESCYLSGGHAALLRVPNPDGSGDTVILGAPDPLYNNRLDQRGNASLALQLLGQRRDVIWYLPSLSDNSVSAERSDFLDLLPAGWRWGALQLTLAAVIAALWRVRRLGPVVSEALPVTVRAAEATEGRARLYQKAGARSRAAEALRQATLERLAPMVGVPSALAGDSELLTTTVAAHTQVPESEIRSLLYGPAPRDDASLLRLADGLDSLTSSLQDWQVHSS